MLNSRIGEWVSSLCSLLFLFCPNWQPPNTFLYLLSCFFPSIPHKDHQRDNLRQTGVYAILSTIKVKKQTPLKFLPFLTAPRTWTQCPHYVLSFTWFMNSGRQPGQPSLLAWLSGLPSLLQRNSYPFPQIPAQVLLSHWNDDFTSPFIISSSFLSVPREEVPLYYYVMQSSICVSPSID